MDQTILICIVIIAGTLTWFIIEYLQSKIKLNNTVATAINYFYAYGIKIETKQHGNFIIKFGEKEVKDDPTNFNKKN